MTRAGRSAGIALLCVALAFPMSGCGPAPQPGLLLQEGAVSCVPTKPHERSVIAEQTRLEDPESPVTLTKLELVNPTGIRLIEAFAVRYAEKGGIGTMSLDEPDDAWATRVPAMGAVIDGDERWSVAFVLERTGEERGRADAVAYTFTDSSGEVQRAVGSLALQVDDPDDPC